MNNLLQEKLSHFVKKKKLALGQARAVCWNPNKSFSENGVSPGVYNPTAPQQAIISSVNFLRSVSSSFYNMAV